MWSRRSFLSMAGWGAVLSSLGIGTLAWGRMMYPRVLFEEQMAYKVGFPNEYAPNKVSDKWIKAYRFWLIRTPDRFIALSAVCTHLGCTPRYLATEDKFKCPCHGSGFRGLQSGVAGLNFEGPAPRPLERFKITLAEDGQIFIDKSVVFRQDKGEWDEPGASLSYIA
ncbi:MAG: ubiquinol-cytochrome c reductase iron-sulfur subunit [Deltaproteobacteria bacterium]|nr:ubiquinol-cytochrome c reductase iron-sulfur subunit [Deltaproteobacteria bacterium]